MISNNILIPFYFTYFSLYLCDSIIYLCDSTIGNE